MSVKRYISKTGVKYSFLLEVKGRVKSISFRGNEKDCIVKDQATQKELEESSYFKEGLIGVAPGTTAGGFDEDVIGLAGGETVGEKLEVKRANSKTRVEQEAEEDNGPTDPAEPTLFPDITDINGAIAVLKGDPYKIHHMKLKSLEEVKDQARLNNVEFPNWN